MKLLTLIITTVFLHGMALKSHSQDVVKYTAYRMQIFSRNSPDSEDWKEIKSYKANAEILIDKSKKSILVKDLDANKTINTIQYTSFTHFKSDGGIVYYCVSKPSNPLMLVENYKENGISLISNLKLVLFHLNPKPTYK